MPIHSVIFFAALLGACAYALVRGGGPERGVAWTMLYGVAATRLTFTALPLRYKAVEWPMLAVDLTVLAGFAWIAFKANRRWPMIVLIIHAMTVGAHAVKMVDPTLIRTVYWMMTNLWIYPQLAILAVATYRHRRRVIETGADASWSNFSVR